MRNMSSNSNLFSVEGIVAVITGGGSGMFIFSEEKNNPRFLIYLHYLFYIHSRETLTSLDILMSSSVIRAWTTYDPCIG